MCPLQVDLNTCVDLHSVVLHLHGAVLLTLIVAQRLVEQVVGVGVDCKLLLLSPGVAGVEVEIVHVVVVAVESTAGAHLVDERRSEVVRQTEAQSTLLEEKARHWQYAQASQPPSRRRRPRCRGAR